MKIKKQKENASKLEEMQTTLKGHSEIELESFDWTRAVSIMVLSDYGYMDIESGLKMDYLVPRWERALNIANSVATHYHDYDYVMGVCYLTTLAFLHDYGHFKNVKELKTSLVETIKSISEKNLLVAELYVDALFSGEEREAFKALFKFRAHAIGEEIGSAAYNCLTKEQFAE